jgi:hypothetical protein
MGEVVELGSGVTRLAKGDIVAALVPSSPERRQQHYRRVNLFLRLPLDDHKLASELVEQSPAWLENGTNKPNNHALQGLDAVPDGFQEYRDGKISLTRLSMNRLSSMSSVKSMIRFPHSSWPLYPNIPDTLIYTLLDRWASDISDCDLVCKVVTRHYHVASVRISQLSKLRKCSKRACSMVSDPRRCEIKGSPRCLFRSCMLITSFWSVRRIFLASCVRFHDCPRRLYTAAPSMTSDNFESTFENVYTRQNLGRILKAVKNGGVPYPYQCLWQSYFYTCARCRPRLLIAIRLIYPPIVKLTI